MKKTHLFLLALTALAACEPTVANRGALLDADLVAQVKPGQSTREEVAAKLGSPTQVSAFDDKVWYYIGRRTEQYSFFMPDVVAQQAVEVDFTDSGVVADVKRLDLSQAGDIDAVDRVTPTYGRKDTFIRQLLGDVSHPMPDLQGNKGRTGP